MTPAFSPAIASRAEPVAAQALPISAEPAGGHPIAFIVFLILNFLLFVRPTELIPDEDIYGLEIYQYVIVLCLVVGFPTVLRQLRMNVLEQRPITLCMFGFLLAMILSHAARFRFLPALTLGLDYAKTVLYYLLFTGLVTSAARLRGVLTVVFYSVIIVAALSLLNFYDVIALPTFDPMVDSDEHIKTGVVRLCGAGMFRDPNDFCVLLAIGVPLCLARLLDPRRTGYRFFWLAPMALLLHAIHLTRSRGGFLALLAGIGVLLVMRYGKRAGLMMVLVLPPALLIGGARQMEISTNTGTAQERIQVWADALEKIKSSPLFGVGMKEFTSDSRLVAHNSYLHVFAELGLFGGTCFVGACFLAVRQILRRRATAAVIADPEMRWHFPFIAAMCGTYFFGMMSLSLAYLVPTVMFPAVGDVTSRVVPIDPPAPEDRADARLLVTVVSVSFAFLAFMFVFVRLSFR